MSVVVPCHNSASRIRDTVESILAQYVGPLEVILVGNKSTDDTLEVLRELEETSAEVRVFSVVADPVARSERREPAGFRVRSTRAC